jgi:hypothetical protein
MTKQEYLNKLAKLADEYEQSHGNMECVGLYASFNTHTENEPKGEYFEYNGESMEVTKLRYAKIKVAEEETEENLEV